MSQTTVLIFFSEREAADPVALLKKLIAFIDTKKFRSAWVYTPYELSLAQLLEDREDPEADLKSTRRGRMASREMAPDEAPRYYEPGMVLSIYPYDSTLGLTLREGILAAVPETVRYEAAPSDPSITIGRHDILHEDEMVNGPDGWPLVTLVGRAWMSLSFMGYGTPYKWKEYAELVADVPEVKRIQRDLEAMTGGPIGLHVSYSN